MYMKHVQTHVGYGTNIITALGIKGGCIRYDIEGECGCILHISCIIKDPGINGGCTDTYDGYILDACSGYQ